MKRHDVAYGRITFITASFAIACICGYFFGDEIHNSEKPSEYIGVTFSILAAALLAVISIIGDPSMLLTGGWRTGKESAKTIQVRLHKLYNLFHIYMITLLLLIVTEVVEFAMMEDFYFLHNVFVFFAAFGLILSFGLPFELASIQKERLDSEIKNRKSAK